MVAEPVKLIIWGLCLFSSPLFSFSNFNSFHDIYMHIIVSSHKLAVQLWGAFKIVFVCEEMVGLCVCSNECCHVPVSAAAATVWSSNVGRVHRVAQRLQSGLVWTNCWLVRDLNLPFGGMKASGIGREGAKDSYEFFTEVKTITSSQ